MTTQGIQSNLFWFGIVTLVISFAFAYLWWKGKIDTAPAIVAGIGSVGSLVLAGEPNGYVTGVGVFLVLILLALPEYDLPKTWVVGMGTLLFFVGIWISSSLLDLGLR
jgi:hypothetical protein